MTTSASQQRENDRRPLVLAGALGLVTAVLVVVFLRNSEDNPAVQIPTLSVVAASVDVPAGRKLTAEMLQFKDVPETALPTGSFRATDKIIGQTARYPIPRGELVTQSRLVEPPKVQAISFQIPAGKRAMTIPVSASTTPSSLAAPGDFVDIMVRGQATTLFGPQRVPLSAGLGTPALEIDAVAMLIQNIQILSVGSTYVNDGVVYDSSVRGEPAKQGASNVTLAVTPEQAQLIFLAQANGTFALILRAFGDEEVPQIAPRFDPPIVP